MDQSGFFLLTIIVIILPTKLCQLGPICLHLIAILQVSLSIVQSKLDPFFFFFSIQLLTFFESSNLPLMNCLDSKVSRKVINLLEDSNIFLLPLEGRGYIILLLALHYCHLLVGLLRWGQRDSGTY